MRRAMGRWGGAFVGVALVFLIAPSPGILAPGTALEIVATGVPRPLQVVLDGRTLVVLSPGLRGEFAGEIYRVDLSGELPVELSRQPRVRIPFPESRLATLGSLALHPHTRELFLGEENGTRLYRLGEDQQLVLYATGLHRLAGGSALAFDGLGRLLILDYVDPALSEGEERAPPGLEQLRDEDYRGPLLFRLTHDPAIPLPRRLLRLIPFFPRGWGGRAGRVWLPYLISVVPRPSGDLVFLTSAGELFRLAADGTFSEFARLPRGQYNRTNMVAAPDGSLLVSGGFHVGSVFRVSPEGGVAVVASHLADPQGLALDPQGNVYVAESSLHRIVRLRPF